MLVLVDLFELEVIVAPELGVASSHGVGCFQQVVAEIAVAGLDHLGMFGLKVTGLVLCPDKAGKLGDRGLGIETVDITNFSNNCFSNIKNIFTMITIFRKWIIRIIF